METSEIRGDYLLTAVTSGLDALREDSLWEAEALAVFETLLLQKKKWLSQFQLNAITTYTRQTIATQILQTSIASLETTHKAYFVVLTQYYLNKQSDQQIVNNETLNFSRSSLRRTRLEAIEKLAAIIAEEESNLRVLWAGEMLAAVPDPSYEELIGRDETVAELVELLQKSGAPWLVNLVGLGGMGKSAVSNAITRQLIQTLSFIKPIWINLETLINNTPDLNEDQLQQHIISQLQQKLNLDTVNNLPQDRRIALIKAALQNVPHLIILDGFDVEFNVRNLLKRLANFSNPSKFLLTGRVKLDPIPLVYIHPLQPLTEAATRTLLQTLATQTGFQKIAKSAPETQQQLLEILNGHPLATELAIRIAEDWSAEDLLEELTAANLEDVNDLYNRIFSRLFTQLTPDALTLLNAMLLVSAEGAERDYLGVLTDFDKNRLNKTLSELTRLSLLNKSANNKFSIHRLTYSFINNRLTNPSASKFTQLAQNGIVYWENSFETLNIHIFSENFTNIYTLLKRSLSIPNLFNQATQLAFSFYGPIIYSPHAPTWISLLNYGESLCQPQDYLLKRRYLSQQAELYTSQAQNDKAKILLDQSLAIAEKHNDIKGLGAIYLAYGKLYRDVNQFTKATIYVDKSIEIYEELRDVTHTFAALEARALIAELQGDYKQSVETLQQILTIDSIPFHKFRLQNIYLTLATSYANLKDTENAQMYLNKATALLNDFNENTLGFIKYSTCQLHIYVLDRNLENALAAKDELEPFLSQQNLPFVTKTIGYKVLGHYYLLQNQTNEAIHSLLIALDNFSALANFSAFNKNPFGMCECHLLLAKAYEHIGESKTASMNMRKAAQLIHENKAEIWTALLIKEFNLPES